VNVLSTPEHIVTFFFYIFSHFVVYDVLTYNTILEEIFGEVYNWGRGTRQRSG
jgi:hypothetical protein